MGQLTEHRFHDADISGAYLSSNQEDIIVLRLEPPEVCESIEMLTIHVADVFVMAKAFGLVCHENNGPPPCATVHDNINCPNDQKVCLRCTEVGVECTCAEGTATQETR